MDDLRHHYLLEKLIQKSDKLVFIYDLATGTFTYLNSAFELIWSLASEKVKAQPSMLLNTLHTEDLPFLEKEYQELLQGQEKERVEFRIILPNKQEKCLQLCPQLLQDEQGKTFVAGMVEDVTINRDNIRNLHKFASKKNSVLEILSHDLAGPLAMIQSLSGSLSETMQQYGNADEQHLIQLIYQTSERSINLIRDFVKQEFLESANAGFIKHRLNLVEKVRQVVEQYQEGQGNIKKHFTFTTSSEKIYVHVDQDKLMQVLNNLISNSIKFTHDHGQIDVELQETETGVLIVIRDNGIGIPQKYQANLFDKFTPARRNGLKGEPSVGLGMSLIKTIVEWHQGRIWFESQENQGTTFFIEIPKD